MADYLIVNKETEQIENIIVIDNPELINFFNAKEFYEGARIGDYYIPANSKLQKINESKIKLADFLNTHPILWKDGKQYSVTQEKQSQLTSVIATYEIESKINPSAVVTWNSTGEECSEWDIQELCELAVSIKDYIKPLVTYQQRKEIEIKNCKKLSELESIEIDYDSLISQ